MRKIMSPLRSCRSAIRSARNTRRKLFLIAFPALLILGPFVAVILSIGDDASAAWYNNSWLYRKQIVINSSQVSGSGSHTEFPVLVSLTDSDLSASAQSDGDDIFFTSSDGTTILSHQIEKYTSGTGELLAWVNIPSLSATADTPIYMYYGNSAASNQEDTENVWDSNYKGIWHFDETSGTQYDSTSNNNDSSAINVSTQGSATGKANGANDYATGDEVTITENGTLDITGDFTIEAWIDPDTLPASGDNYSGIVYKSGNANYFLELKDGGDIDAGYHNGSDWQSIVSATDPVSAGGGFYYTVVTFNDSTNTITAYVNTTQVAQTTSASGSPNPNDGNLTFGENAYNETYDGIIDEVRISNTARSTDWLSTTYNNINDPSSFITLGSQEQQNTMILHWRLNEGSGTTAQDSSGESNSGTISGAVWKDSSQCIEEKCLEFDGTDDSVMRADDSDMDFTAVDEMSVETWFRHGPQSSGTDVLISKYESTGADGGYKVYMDDDGDIVCGIDDDNTSFPEDSAASTTADYDDNEWHHVLCVKDGTSSLTLYIDGVQIAQDSSISSTGSLENNDAFYVGIDGDGTSNPWGGFIDQVKVHKEALTTAQVTTNYNNGSASILGRKSSNLSDGLVGYWKMDESSWTNDCSTESVIDSSGNNNHGESCPNADGITALGSGKFGNSPDFDSSNDYVQVDDNDVLDITGAVTLSAWVKADTFSSGTTENRIIQKGGGSHSNNLYTLEIDDNNARFVLHNQSGIPDTAQCDGSSTQQCVRGSTTLSTGSWYHIIGVYDGNRTLKIYVNGTEDGSVTLGATSTGSSNANVLAIGGRADSAADMFDGSIDEARVYTRALSPSEVVQLYTFAPGPVGYWDFEEGTGTTTNDRSGNSHTGSLNGTKWTTGKFGTALIFNSSDSEYVSVSDNNPLDITSQGTWSAWIYLNSTGSTQNIFQKDANNGYSVYIDSSNRLTFFQHNGSGDNRPASNTSFTTARWYHIAITKDGTTLKYYVDGSLRQTIASTHSSINANTLDLGIGARVSDQAGPFDGLIDEAKIYNYARTPSQIIEDMNGGHPIGGSPISSQIGFWRFDEGYGTTANNIGNGGSTLNGTITGASWSNLAKSGKAIDFDGSDDVLTITNSNAIDMDTGLSSAHSFTAWVYADSDGESDTGIIYSKGTNTWLRVDSQDGSNNLDLEASLDLTTTDATINIADAFTTSGWNHVSVVYEDDGDDEIQVYVNGILKGTSTGGSGTPAITDSSDLYIGNNSGTTQTFDGKIDEFKVYNAALTANQVLLDFNSGKSTVLGSTGTDASGNPSNSADRAFCPPGDSTATCGPVGFWNFEEGSGSSAYDKSGNGYTGTLDSDAKWSVGKIGYGINYPNSGDVNMGDVLDFSDGQDFSISYWTMRNTCNNDSPVRKRSGTASTAVGYLILLNSGCRLVPEVADGTDEYSVTSTSQLSANTWYHIVAVFDEDVGFKIYINGRDDTNYSSESGTIGDIGNLTNSTDLRIGLGGYDGKIDEVKIYNYALSPSQIAWDYNKGKPVAHFRFDECSGTSVNDSMGNISAGLITIGGSDVTTIGNCSTGSTAWGNGAVGKFNYSISTDGTDDYIQIDDDSKLDAPGDFTVGLWIKTSQSSVLDQYPIILKKADASPPRYGYEFVLHDSNVDDTWYGQIHYNSIGYKVTGASDIADGQWHHIAMVRSGSTLYAYEDGRLVDTNSSAVSSDLSTAANLRMGKNTHDGFPYWLDAQYDDLQFFNYALTSQQIRNVVNAGAVRYGGN